MFPKSFYHSLVFQIILKHSSTGQTQVHLRDFEKHENM